MINNNFTKYKIYKSIFTIFVFLLEQIIIKIIKMKMKIEDIKYLIQK